MIFDRNEYNFFLFKVCYFHAETEAKVDEDYKSLAKQLEVEEEKEEDRIRKVNGKLTKLAKTNEIVFIFDNVQDYTFIEKYICNLPKSICVLTTARNKDTISDERVFYIQLEPFTSDEAINYVVKVLGEENIQKKEIDDLVRIIGDKNEVIPFNLNKVVSYLSKPSSKTVKETLENIKRKPELWLRTEFYDDFMKNETIAKILEFIPYFDPDSIDIKLLKHVMDHVTNKKSIEDTLFDDALDELLKSFLIKYDNRKISVHRLLQKDLGEYFKKSKDKEKIRENFLKIIDENFRNAYEVWDNKDSTHMHAISLVEKNVISNNIEKSNKINVTKASIFCKLGAFYHIVQIKFKIAKKYLLRALEIYVKLVLGNNENVAKLYCHIGSLFKDISDYNSSLEYHNKALEMFQKLFQSDHPSIAQLYIDIATVYFAMGIHKKSLEFSNKALEMYQQLFQDDHLGLAHTYKIMGDIFRDMKNFKQSLDYYRKSLEKYRKLYKGDHPWVASSYNNIGVIYIEIKDYKRSIDYLNEALEMYKRLFKGDHLNIALLYINIGKVFTMMGDYKQSLDYFKKALGMYQKIYQSDHKHISVSYTNMGIVYNAMKNYRISMKYHTKALEMYKRLFGDEHQTLAKSYDYIANVYSDKKDYTNSLEYHIRALEMNQRLFKGDHSYIARSHRYIAKIFEFNREYGKSIEHLKKSLEMYKQVFQDDCVVVIETLQQIASVFEKMQDLDQAKYYNIEAIEMIQRLSLRD